VNFDEYFSEFAYTARIKSKDPSSQIGAVIVGPDNQLISAGFNGFPRGVDENAEYRWERPIKYEYVCHAEENAIYNAARHGIALRGATLYLAGFGPPTVPCTHCAKAVIQSGIARVVGQPYKEARQDWLEDLYFAWKMLVEAQVVVDFLPMRIEPLEYCFCEHSHPEIHTLLAHAHHKGQCGTSKESLTVAPISVDNEGHVIDPTGSFWTVNQGEDDNDQD
jgi:dCMP deaminase